MSREVFNLRDGREHSLIDAEKQIGNPGTADRWLREDVPQAEVVKSSDVLPSVV